MRGITPNSKLEPDIPIRSEEVAERTLVVAGLDRLDDHRRVCRVRNLDCGVAIGGRDTKNESAGLSSGRENQR